MRKLRVNSVECAKCGDVLISMHRHDWVQCKCGAVFTDGGTEYIRRGGSPEDMIDRSVWEDLPDEGATKI